MLKDITIGQYYPSSSPIHRMNAAVKILLTLIYMVAIFFVDGFIGYGIVAAFLLFVLLCSKIPPKFILKGLKPIVFFVIITVILNLFMTKGTKAFTFIMWDVSYEGIYNSVFMALRIIFLVLGSTYLTYTTTPIMLTDGIETLLKPFTVIKLPAYEIAMMMSIALRFIPILIDETDKITKAQKARGADFDSGGLIKKAKALIPVLVPLFISAFRRADELAMAMEARCYNGSGKRSRMNKKKLSLNDALCSFVFILFFVAALLPGIMNFEIRGF